MRGCLQCGDGGDEWMGIIGGMSGAKKMWKPVAFTFWDYRLSFDSYSLTNLIYHIYIFGSILITHSNSIKIIAL